MARPFMHERDRSCGTSILPRPRSRNGAERLQAPLRISAPVSFGTLHLGPALFGLLRTHPDIELSLELDDRFVDVLAEGYDAVVRHGPVEDKRLIVKKLAASRRVLVASPDYLKRFGRPDRKSTR